ncbi:MULTISPECIES: carbohydrate ABC transporter permease [Cryobacterium]|uniref:Sugar ABC transporter permease n=1 Tax=Cryobacterium glucosi TaxID=1259175 RepID=A0ABY2IK71_9MICO|nr:MULTISPECIES: sugar ABC transporter permease [Cryobacterium]MDY7529996.1 sugar ABC transporter permease [Cryobacterium sp. 10C2]MDY7544427.1 sugar ABC transporter permease [Cryobacterium sp. 5B3]MEB0000759.1 sugar ABC transporter permease [Cryobacterium sp. RTS3]MEB0202631.1 sugar ABC transporter permease [Cryobacterium sp. 5I3]MEB0267485.1 sugar ABC transporter permease [Cryobacterium sp. 10I5]
MTTTRSRHRLTITGLLGPFIVLFTLTMVLPLVYAIYESVTGIQRSGAFGQGGSSPVFVGLDNYITALGASAFVASLGRVLLFAVVQVPVMIILATALALLLDAASAWGVRFFRSAYFLPYGVPGVIASILWGFLYTPGLSPLVNFGSALGLNLDFLGGGSILWSIANIVTWQYAGYNMLVIVAQLKSIDADLFEAASIDGANAWQVITRIKLPLIRPAIVLTTVFTIIGTIQLFAEPLVLKPLSSAITSSFTPNLSAYNEAFANNNYNLAAAESVLLALVACAFSFGFLKLVTRGGSPS